VCYFATDIHSQTLGHGKNDDSIKRVKDINGELIMVRSLESYRPQLASSHQAEFPTHKQTTNTSLPTSQIFGKKDTHVPPEGRDLIRKTLHDAGVTFSFYEPAWAQHAFIRDELSKYVFQQFKVRLQTTRSCANAARRGRYDPALAGICFQMLLELFGRTLNGDLGPMSGEVAEPEDVC
jgi:carboxymethylenebutenolidase